MKNRNLWWPFSNLVCPFSKEESKSIMAYFKWTSHFGWFVSHFGRSAVLTIHRHVLSFGPSVIVRPPTLGGSWNFTKRQNLQWPILNLVCPFSNEESKSITVYFKSSMPFFERTMPFLNEELKSMMAFLKFSMPFFEWRIEIYDGLFQI